MRQRSATLLTPILLVAAISTALSGCSSILPQPPTAEQKAEQKAEQIEPMLTAAGFRMLPADTPERQQRLATLAPLEVNYYIGKTGTLHYYMADPDYCKCMYIGSEENYQKYDKLKLDQQFEAKEGVISRENLEAQQMEDMDLQEEMFNPYGLNLWGPMGPSIYW
jgi:hypothetical protein